MTDPSASVDSGGTSAKHRFLLTIDKGHRSDHPYDVVWLNAKDADEALRIAAATDQGYVMEGDTVYVTRAEDVSHFAALPAVEFDKLFKGGQVA